MKKRGIVITLAMGITFSLCACGNNVVNTQVTSQAQESTDSESTAETIESSVEEGNAHGASERKNTEELMAEWNFDMGDISLETVVSDLQNNNIAYTGLYNLSGERIDMELEDGNKLIFFQTKDSDMNDSGYHLVMKNDEFNANCFQEDFLNAYDVITDEYYYTDSPDTLLELDGVYPLTKTRLSILRNQIYASHGRKFEDPFLMAVFSQKSWYVPTGEGTEFDEKVQRELSENEKKNLKLISYYENARGYLKSDEFSCVSGIVNGSSFDLDGDGNKEIISYVRGELNNGYYGDADLTIIDGKTGEKIVTSIEGEDLYELCHVGSMNGKDWFILVGSDGPSADYASQFFNYKSGKVKKIGEIMTDVANLRLYQDKITGDVETFHIQCQPVLFTYKIANDEIIWQEQDYYEYLKNVITALTDITLCDNINGDAVVPIKKGDEVIIAGGDMKEWVYLEDKTTGVKGWLKVINGQCYRPDGSYEESSLWFDGLYFYG